MYSGCPVARAIQGPRQCGHALCFVPILLTAHALKTRTVYWRPARQMLGQTYFSPVSLLLSSLSGKHCYVVNSYGQRWAHFSQHFAMWIMFANKNVPAVGPTISPPMPGSHVIPFISSPLFGTDDRTTRYQSKHTYAIANKRVSVSCI